MDRSQLLLELKKQRRQKRSRLDPSHKIIAAFSLSVEARKLRIAGLWSQGFSESEINQILRTRRK